MTDAHNPFSLVGRTILLTGATGHLGAAMARALAKAGGHVLVNGRSEDACATLASALRTAGLSADAAAFNILDEKATAAFFERRAGQPLHAIVNNAYAGGGGTIETAGADAYADSYRITVTAAHRLLRHALPALRQAAAAGGSAVINIASMYGVVSPDISLYAAPAGANPPFYGAAKAALIQWTRYAACEFGREGIRVNAVSPGPFPAPSVRESAPDFVARLETKVPLGRVGEADEIGGVVVFLASPASSYVNGANIPVDGGWTSW